MPSASEVNGPILRPGDVPVAIVLCFKSCFPGWCRAAANEIQGSLRCADGTTVRYGLDDTLCATANLLYVRWKHIVLSSHAACRHPALLRTQRADMLPT